MNIQTTDALNELAPDAVAELKRFFHASDDNGKKADYALKLLGRINGNDSNKIKLLSLQFQIARLMGVKGEPLRPLLSELNQSFARATEPKEAGKPLAQ